MSYLLFVRSATDLDRVCREVNEFLDYQGRQSLPASRKVHGVWIDPDTLFHIPRVLVPPSWRASDRGFLIRESFGVSGMWQLAGLQVPAEVTHGQDLPRLMIESLHGLAEGTYGLFAPVFNGDTDRPAMREALSRLHRRYPGGLAPPLAQDRHSGALERLGGLDV